MARPISVVYKRPGLLFSCSSFCILMIFYILYLSLAMLSDSELVCRMKQKQMEKEEVKGRLKQALKKKEEEKQIKRRKKPSENELQQQKAILNQELDILWLEFQIEEAQSDPPEQFLESIDVNKEYCCDCCCCQTNQEIDVKELRVGREFFHAKNMEDAERKKEKKRERYEQLHSFGWENCQFYNKEQGLSRLSVYTVLCPPLWCLFGIYNCYSCIHNCKYRAASRTKRILEVYERAGKHFKFSQLQAYNKVKIQRLKKSLSAAEAQARERKKQLLNGSSSQIQLLNLDLERLEGQFKLGDVEQENYFQTIASNRGEECGCFTSQLDPYREVPCDAQSLKEYCRVENGKEFHQKIEKLQQMDREVGTCRCELCISLGSYLGLFTGKHILDKCYMIQCLLFPVYAILSPFMSAYNCCQCLCDRCYRRTSRIHQLFETYDGYRNFIANRSSF